jgi:hypothetical protein
MKTLEFTETSNSQHAKQQKVTVIKDDDFIKVHDYIDLFNCFLKATGFENQVVLKED